MTYKFVLNVHEYILSNIYILCDFNITVVLGIRDGPSRLDFQATKVTKECQN